MYNIQVIKEFINNINSGVYGLFKTIKLPVKHVVTAVGVIDKTNYSVGGVYANGGLCPVDNPDIRTLQNTIEFVTDTDFDLYNSTNPIIARHMSTGFNRAKLLIMSPILKDSEDNYVFTGLSYAKVLKEAITLYSNSYIMNWIDKGQQYNPEWHIRVPDTNTRSDKEMEMLSFIGENMSLTKEGIYVRPHKVRTIGFTSISCLESNNSVRPFYSSKNEEKSFLHTFGMKQYKSDRTTLLNFVNDLEARLLLTNLVGETPIETYRNNNDTTNLTHFNEMLTSFFFGEPISGQGGRRAFSPIIPEKAIPLFGVFGTMYTIAKIRKYAEENNL